MRGAFCALPIRHAPVDSLTVFGVALAWTLPTPIGVPLLGIILWFAARSVQSPPAALNHDRPQSEE